MQRYLPNLRNWKSLNSQHNAKTRQLYNKLKNGGVPVTNTNKYSTLRNKAANYIKKYSNNTVGITTSHSTIIERINTILKRHKFKKIQEKLQNAGMMKGNNKGIWHKNINSNALLKIFINQKIAYYAKKFVQEGIVKTSQNLKKEYNYNNTQNINNKIVALKKMRNGYHNAHKPRLNEEKRKNNEKKVKEQDEYKNYKNSLKLTTNERKILNTINESGPKNMNIPNKWYSRFKNGNRGSREYETNPLEGKNLIKYRVNVAKRLAKQRANGSSLNFHYTNAFYGDQRLTPNQISTIISGKGDPGSNFGVR